ncbi:unnamed protein product [Tuber aestivum]|uniref:Uncharacterized protein n=1 Tax=Tuber aestivum TaxID=59557 RepID=A0A292PX84_9PEZI|nr:unnamed protein product [Tuber aestivum]
MDCDPVSVVLDLASRLFCRSGGVRALSRRARGLNKGSVFPSALFPPNFLTSHHIPRAELARAFQRVYPSFHFIQGKTGGREGTGIFEIYMDPWDAVGRGKQI